MKFSNIYFLLLYPVFSLMLVSAVFAQQNMEGFLNSVDAPSSWANTPVAAPAVPLSPQNYTNPSNHNYPLIQPNNAQFTGQTFLQTLLRQSVLKSNFRTAKEADWGASTAYSDWQEAENQASKARNAEERARYDKDKWRRGDDASESYYAAGAARNASDRVYRASQNGDPTAKQYADRSRAAADRARADSDQARYYADSSN